MYLNSKAFIYPSKEEFLGLPLIEASNFNLPILAPELDYVRDILDPIETFDPNSAMSIKRALKRFLGIYEEKIKVIETTTFLKKILK